MATDISNSVHYNDSDRATAASSAAIQLHRAELALHDARQTQVDAWITAAAERLHVAAMRYSRIQGALAA